MEKTTKLTSTPGTALLSQAGAVAVAAVNTEGAACGPAAVARGPEAVAVGRWHHGLGLLPAPHRPAAAGNRQRPLRAARFGNPAGVTELEHEQRTERNLWAAV